MSGPHTPGLITPTEDVFRLWIGKIFIADFGPRAPSPANMQELVANRARVAACWNAFDGWTLEQIERAGKWIQGLERGEIEDILKESGA